jgi:hypothetical protein
LQVIDRGALLPQALQHCARVAGDAFGAAPAAVLLGLAATAGAAWPRGAPARRRRLACSSPSASRSLSSARGGKRRMRSMYSIGSPSPPGSGASGVPLIGSTSR